MDEYYCPNCGAMLNDQYGFDPSCGTWTCTGCGKLLMDDDVYTGDSYEGIAWFCDACGALLNRQSGFSDSYGSWTCTECGYRNGTTEDDILKEDDGPECPNCGAKLKDQFCYDNYQENWKCTECGVHLHHCYSSDPYTIVEENKGPECPNCGAYLKDQFCFADYKDNWECTECGAHLHHNYISDPYTIVEEDKGPKCPNCGAYLKIQFCFADYEDDWECTECGAHLHHEYSSDPYKIVDVEDVDEDDSNYSSGSFYTYTTTSYTYPKQSSHSTSASQEKKEQKLPERELRKQRIKAFFFKRKKIQLGYDYSDLLGKNIDTVETLLYNQAFNNVKKIPIKDVYVDSPYFVGQVEQVVIQGSSYFQEGDLIPYDAEIIITYHIKREISIPFSYKVLRKMNYIAAGDEFQKLGFTEIYEHPIRDLVTGWVKKDGSVEKITIGDICPFKKNSVFTYDTKITIEYHTFKKK